MIKLQCLVGKLTPLNGDILEQRIKVAIELAMENREIKKVHSKCVFAPSNKAVTNSIIIWKRYYARKVPAHVTYMYEDGVALVC